MAETEEVSQPQDLEQKLRRPERQQWTRARIKLSDLRDKRGFRILQADASGPVLVEVSPMDSVWTWKRVTTGAEGHFELMSVK